MLEADTLHADAPDFRAVGQARAGVRKRLAELGREAIRDDVELIVSELVTNALLHARGCTGVQVVDLPDGVRIEVSDARPVPPVLGLASPDAMTGRGLRLVDRLSSRWGARPVGEGKVVWAEVSEAGGGLSESSVDDLLDIWDDPDAWTEVEETPVHRYPVVLGDVPTDLLLAAKWHVDNLVREFALAAAGARSGTTAAVVPHLAELIETVTHRFSEARDAIKRQALEAAGEGAARTRLELSLPLSAADAGEEYLEALDEVDSYCRAARLLTLETPPAHRIFRRWYVEELVRQLRAEGAGEVPPPPKPFEARVLEDLERMASSQQRAEKSARLYAVAGALAGAATPEAVASAVLSVGVEALGASGGGILLASAADQLIVPGTVGYDEEVVARLRAESKDAELPAAVALRTGDSIWIESREERDEAFPELVALEPRTVSVCAVPLEVQGRRLGALRFSFSEPRLFDPDERRFIATLAAQSAQALDRAQLQQSRLDLSDRLQRSLLPPPLPPIEGLQAAALYHPLGDGMEVGGDFYDIWPMEGGQFALAIGDVVGTGPEAAALTALLRFSLRALTMRSSEPVATLQALNQALRSAPRSDGGETFCTAIFACLRRDGDAMRVTLASGGHPPPGLRRADGSIEEIFLGGSLLGAFAAIDVAAVEVTLHPGDALVLFTDGVVEARDRTGAMFDYSGLLEVLARVDGSAHEIAEAIEKAVLSHVGQELKDDMAALVLKVDGVPGRPSDPPPGSSEPE
ncbi:MAG TPA: SpoIIE family protein phosphatase [Acidimicrobiales bacterium]|nr:SpoIIE family protein phosphatase [Acidimicrobiales bacterium]